MNSSMALAWFARHEFRLMWREWVAMMTAGRRARLVGVVAGFTVVAVIMHLLAYAVVGRVGDIDTAPAKTTLILVTASIVLAWALVLSQAIESVTRVFYTRADLDLVMSSPFAMSTVVSVRMTSVAITMIALALVMVLPFVDVLAISGGTRWFAAYGVTVAGGLSATAVALLATVALFRICGPRRTRFVAQIVSAIVGAGFVISLQIGAILSYGTMSRYALLLSGRTASHLPDPDSMLWWPARAMLGDGTALFMLLAAALVLLGMAMMVCAPVFGGNIASVSGTAAASVKAKQKPFRLRSPQQALRRKELLLLRRDPWLLSQTLMQFLYLAPPALMMWRTFGNGSGTAMLLAPVIVMAAGQLAGGVAWLSISGEDAPDLIATTPLPPSAVIRAKIEVVLMVIGVTLVPLLVPMAVASPSAALVAGLGAAIAAVTATSIQLWFRAQARRSQFRRRHTSSRIATFAEAFSSIGWAAAVALVFVNPIVAAVTAVMTLTVLALTWAISPRRA
jgi:ABC-2 type transport system permease protein